MELKDRIAAIMKQTSLNAPAFAKLIGAKTSQAVYDLLSGKTKTLSSDMLVKMMACFPQLSAEWIVTGEGDMNKPSVLQTSHGDYSPNMYGGNNNFGGTNALDQIIAELTEQRKMMSRTLAMLEKRDSQIDRLITLLENKNI